MVDYEEFVSKPKSMLIAPAGYGKTHTIAECLKFTKGKQLILTHTHAGVASLKEKIHKASISSSNAHVETITSFAQKYTLSFYTKKDIPEQGDNKNYYPFIVKKATEFIKIKPISDIIRNTYSGLFVDEYQDCTAIQHELILALSEILPTHILGDFLQGIFGFKNEVLVDLEDPKCMGEFANNKYELDKPWRWEKINEQLGGDLKTIRQKLIDHAEIDLSQAKSIELNIVVEGDLFNPKKDYYKKVKQLLQEKSLLIIHPDTLSVNPRIAVVKAFSSAFTLVESIDDKDFYELSRELDNVDSSDVAQVFIKIGFKIFNKTGLSIWFNDKGIKRKQKIEDLSAIQPIRDNFEVLKNNLSYSLLADTFKKVKLLPGVKCYRRELFSSLCKALEDADCNQLSVYDSMVNKRNSVRKMGRKVYGKCIGTTLLTKGLEFDIVAILNAHKFNCSKNLYVALTRASRRLIIFTNNSKLTPYS